MYRYPLRLRTNCEDLTFRIGQTTPTAENVKISDLGVVQWQVPRDQTPGDYRVLVAITDSQRRRTSFPFRVEVTPAKSAPADDNASPRTASPPSRTGFSQKRSPPRPARTWSFWASGRTFDGRFIKLLPDDKIRIRRNDGRIYDLPLDRLAEKDGQFVRSQTQKEKN